VNDPMETGLRRLPVYLLLDTSESMAGPAIEAVEQGVSTLVSELRTNPLAIETAYLSVITFGREAQQTVPLTELMEFRAPTLRVRTGTALGGALQLLLSSLERDVQKTTEGLKGDYRPLVFILTDGQPTDDWEPHADGIKALVVARRAHILAIGCGPDIDTEVLYRVTDTALVMPNLTPEAIRKSFIWLSASVQTVSAKIQEQTEKGSLELPQPPSDALQGAPLTSNRRDQAPRQVFLHALCSTTELPYLMRFLRRAYDGQYDAIAAHKLETVDEGDKGSQISASQLCGIPPCPHCKNPGAIPCPVCNVVFCSSGKPQPEVNCPNPKCKAILVKSDKASDDDFRINLSDG
jgi:uncharacterized protein YegL